MQVRLHCSRHFTSDFFGLNPILISSDSAPVRVRRLLKRLIDQERAGGLCTQTCRYF